MTSSMMAITNVNAKVTSSGIEITEDQVDTDVITKVPSQGKYVFVGGCGGSKSLQRTVVLTLFSLSFSGEGDARFHYEVLLMEVTKPLHKVEAISTT